MTAMPLNVRIRLSIMMFLQYMMFAVWWVPLAAYLKNADIQGTLEVLDSQRHAAGLPHSAGLLHDGGPSLRQPEGPDGPEFCLCRAVLPWGPAGQPRPSCS